MSDPHAQGSTTAQLKADIDAGRTGDKVAGLDPAAAPLGTDDEAGGATHDPHLMARVRHAERAETRMGRKADPAPNAATPELAPDGRMDEPPRTREWLIGAGLGVALAAGLLLILL